MQRMHIVAVLVEQSGAERGSPTYWPLFLQGLPFRTFHLERGRVHIDWVVNYDVHTPHQRAPGPGKEVADYPTPSHLFVLWESIQAEQIS